MNLFKIETENTNVISKTYSLLQMINLIAGAVLAVASLISTIFLAFKDELLWLIPLGAFFVVAFICVLIHMNLQVLFGMYYDIRMTRILAEGNRGESKANDEELPEL